MDSNNTLALLLDIYKENLLYSKEIFEREDLINDKSIKTSIEMFIEQCNLINTTPEDVKEEFLTDVVLIFILRVLLYKKLYCLENHKITIKDINHLFNSEFLGNNMPKNIGVLQQEFSYLNSLVFHNLEVKLFLDSIEGYEEQYIKLLNYFNKVNVNCIDDLLIGEFYQKIISVNKRKILGEFYTPISIINYIVEKVVFSQKGYQDGLILDPSCGCGAFLNYTLQQSGENSSDLDIKNLFGFEINPFSAAVARFMLRWRSIDLKKETDTPNILNIDALSTEELEGEEIQYIRDKVKFDYIIGNPPYIRAERYKNGEQIKKNWEAIWGQNSDVSYAFIYRALTEWLAPGGKLGFVVSGGLANAKAASKLRKLLRDEYTLKEVVWLEFCGKVWDASAIPMILIVENRKPKDDDIIKISAPTEWPTTVVEYNEFRYDNYFSPEVNPEGYILPLIDNEDIGILRQLSGLGTLGDELSFKYGIQRGSKAPIKDTSNSGEYLSVIDGKSISVAKYGDEIGYVDISKVQKKSIWMSEIGYPPYKSINNKQILFDLFDEDEEDNGYIAIPGITLAPTAAYIPTLSLGALDTIVVGKCKNITMAKAITAYLNSSICRYITLIQLRAGVMEGSKRLHMYPRTLESLPWNNKVNDSIIRSLADHYDELAWISNSSDEINRSMFEETILKIDRDLCDVFNISESHFKKIYLKLISKPLGNLVPRYPWKSASGISPKTSKGDKYSFKNDGLDSKVNPLSGYFKADVKSDTFFSNIHPYHTKLPISVIETHLQHYTEEGDTVLDPFSGSGMTGVACLKNKRKFNISDLSPAAVHIAKGYLQQVSVDELIKEQVKIKAIIERESQRYYKTICSVCEGDAIIAYTIWADNIKCPHCMEILNLWDASVNQTTGKISDRFNCSKCGEMITKKMLAGVPKVSSEPVITVYDCCGTCEQKRNEHPTTESEKQLIESIQISKEAPDFLMMHIKEGEKWGEQFRSGYHHGVTKVEHFYTKRNYQALHMLHKVICKVENQNIKDKLLFAFTGALFSVSRMVKYIPSRGGRSNVPGTLYISSINLEQNVFAVFLRRLDKVLKLSKWISNQKYNYKGADIVNNTATDLSRLRSNSVDYIFTDPPFGANIQYAELNFIHEAWLNKFTVLEDEMVINKTRKQDSSRYNHLIKLSLNEMYRVLKDDRYLSLVFNNTDPHIWDDLKNSILDVGFEISGVAMLDKGKGGWNQVVNKDGTARYDIILQLRKRQQKLFNKVLPKANSDEFKAFILNWLSGIQEDEEIKRTTPFIHSMAVQYLLTHDINMKPPKPKDLEELISEKWYKNSEGIWMEK